MSWRRASVSASRRIDWAATGCAATATRATTASARANRLAAGRIRPMASPLGAERELKKVPSGGIGALVGLGRHFFDRADDLLGLTARSEAERIQEVLADGEAVAKP